MSWLLDKAERLTLDVMQRSASDASAHWTFARSIHQSSSPTLHRFFRPPSSLGALLARAQVDLSMAHCTVHRAECGLTL